MSTELNQTGHRAEDEVLILRYRDQGDVEALEALVLKYSDGLRGYLCGFLRNALEAEEVFQEVWLRVIRRSDRYRSRNFRGWLFRIAHNVVIDRFRRQKPNVSLDASPDGQPSLGETLDSGTESPRDAVVSVESLEIIAEAVRSLPLPQREVFLMRAVSGLSFKEIAAASGIPLNTALGRMHYAVKKLRTVLRGEVN